MGIGILTLTLSTLMTRVLAVALSSSPSLTFPQKMTVEAALHSLVLPDIYMCLIDLKH